MLRIALPLTLVTLAVVGLFLAAPHAPAGDSPLTAETVEYKAGDVTCEGYLVFDPAVKGARPGVLVVHDWMGIGDFAKAKADALARLGYTAFAADIYGKGVRPKDGKEAGGQAGRFKGDRALLRARVTAAFEALVARKDLVDAARVGSIGFCFGGTTVLELARSGAKVAAAVSFHGGLESPTPADAKQITGTVLALHGADDPFVPAAEVAGFQEEMRAAKVDWQLVQYGGAVHSFTNPAAGNDPSKGAAYQALADARSWIAMKACFDEAFAPKK